MENTTITEKKSIRKYLVPILIIIIAIILCFVCYYKGQDYAIDQSTLESMAQQRLILDETYISKQSDLKKLEDEITAKQAEIDEFNNYKSQKASKDSELAQLNETISAKNNELSTLNTTISAKSAELEQLKTGIVKLQAAPITLPAGYFTVGKDIPEARYSITGSSNFVVYDASGRLKVNTILGNGKYANENYVCTLEEGETIKASSKTTYTPIK